MDPNLKKKKKFFFSFFFFGGGGGGGVGAEWGLWGDRWNDRLTDEQAQTNLPLQLLLSWGYNNFF